MLPDRTDPISEKLHGSLCGFQRIADQVVTGLRSGDVIHGNDEPPTAEVVIHVGSLGNGDPQSISRSLVAQRSIRQSDSMQTRGIYKFDRTEP